MYQNFVNYLRNDELLEFDPSEKTDAKILEVLSLITEKPVFDGQRDKTWFSQPQTGILNENMEIIQGMETEHHLEMLLSYQDGIALKIQEILYLVHFLQEISFWTNLHPETKN